jgi:hypothetical protein
MGALAEVADQRGPETDDRAQDDSRVPADDNTVALAKVIANTRGSSFLQPDAVIMHPANWLNSRLLRDGTGGTAGNYLAGGPFGVSSNNAGGAALFGQTLWDTRVVLSTVVGLGTALVGNFGQAAHVWRAGACPWKRLTVTRTCS